MKILFLNFVARTGSTGKIIGTTVNYLEGRGVKCKTFYGRKPKVDNPNCERFCIEPLAQIQNVLLRLGLTLEYGGSIISTQYLKYKIKKYNPDVVHVHCMNGSCVNIFSLLSFLAKEQYKTIVTHHAEFYYTGVCPHSYGCMGYTCEPGCLDCPRPSKATRALIFPRPHKSWKKMRQAFSLFNKENIVFTSVSPWVMGRSTLSPIVQEFRSVVVKNGVDTSVFNYKQSVSSKIRQVKDDYKRTILHVTAGFNPEKMDDNKGGMYVVKLANMMPDYCFVVVASFASFKQLPPNVYFWGRTENQKELAELYSSCDLTLITSKRETYSMVCAESLCCGTPVVGFKAGGPESISLREFSDFADYGDINQLKSLIEKNINNAKHKEDVAKIAAEEYSDQLMCEKYLNLYKTI